MLPAFNSSTEDAKSSAVQQNLAAIRSSIDLYKVQHNDTFPGYPVGGGTPTEALFLDQLSKVTKKDGTAAALGRTTRYGPADGRDLCAPGAQRGRGYSAARDREGGADVPVDGWDMGNARFGLERDSEYAPARQETTGRAGTRLCQQQPPQEIA